MVDSRYLLRLCVGGTLLLSGGGVQAITTNVTVKAVVLAPPPCEINKGLTIVVDFKNDVMTNQVNGSNYRQPIPYSVSCSGNTTNAMTLQIQGTGAGFGNGNVLSTNQSNLGIALFHSSTNTPLILNKPISFTYPAIPALSAAPIKRSGSTLTAGAFSAGATLKVDFR
ncbi:fimbrial protein [Serratia rubidaea]|uniref:Fimbrial protein n=2 Tax=Serratia rubidaea TaxID=61652 RepID=A0ABS0MFS8_SERRU|nr:fimbrial protein [Serratia rubidaea]